MAQSYTGSSIAQSIDGNVQRVITADEYTEIHQGEQTTGSLEIRCIGLKMTGLKPWHFGMLIGGGIVLSGYFGFEVLNIIKDLVAAYGSPVVQASCGSLELLIFIKDKKSKQRLMKDLLSNNISSKIKSVVGIAESDIRVEVTCIGAVIATSEEFSKLQKHLRTKQKKMQWKVEHDCKSSLIEMCCTLPIFQNKSRMIVEHISPKDASDYLEWAMQDCEFYVSQPPEYLNLSKRGFLAKHRNYVYFTKTQQSHPGLQNKVIRIVKSLTRDEAFSSKLSKISDLLTIDPRHFPGDCDWVLRNLSKITKGLMFEKTFEVAKDLLVWMIRLLNNLLHKKISWFYFVSKLANWFMLSFDESRQYRWELENELRLQAKSIKLDRDELRFFSFMKCIDYEDATSLITFLLKQKSKSAFALATYLAKQLTLKPLFPSWRLKILCFDSETSKFLYALQQCQNKLGHKQFKLFVDFLNKIISKKSFLELKLNTLRETELQLYVGNFPLNLSKLQQYFVYSYDRCFSDVVNILLKCSKQSYKFSIANKDFFRIQHPQRNVSSLQIASFKIIHSINSQCKPQAVSAVELSELILKAHFSNNSLETRHEKLDNFYFDAINLFKDAELAPRSESLFEIFKHGQIVLDHPKFTSRSDFAKLSEFLEMLSPGKIPFDQISMLRFKIYNLIGKVETAFDPFIEFSQQLEMLVKHTTRLMELSGLFRETVPAQEKLESFDTSITEVLGLKPVETSRTFLIKGPARKISIARKIGRNELSGKYTIDVLGLKPMKTSRRFFDKGPARKESIGTTEQSSLKFKQVLHGDASLRKVSKESLHQNLFDKGPARKEVIGRTEQSRLKFKQVLRDDKKYFSKIP